MRNILSVCTPRLFKISNNYSLAQTVSSCQHAKSVHNPVPILSSFCDISSKRMASNFHDGRSSSPTEVKDMLWKLQNKQKVLIVGLGNMFMPGTRHSVGMAFVDYFAQKLDLTWTRDRSGCMGFVTECNISPFTTLYLMKPLPAMNLNGKSVLKTVRKLDIPKRNVYVVLDDLDVAVGECKYKEKGNHRGHNGMRSVMESLSTRGIPRLLIGIGRPMSRQSGVVVDYVLAKFDADEKPVIEKALDTTLQLLITNFLLREVDIGMLLGFYLEDKK